MIVLRPARQITHHSLDDGCIILQLLNAHQELTNVNHFPVCQRHDTKLR